MQLRSAEVSKSVRALLNTTLVLSTFLTVCAQSPPVPEPVKSNPTRRVGGFVPGQQRPSGDPAAIERGGKVYSVTCRACHGADLRGGDIGGPNLLRSQLALSDHDGERIVPVIQGSLASTGMPAINMSNEDAKAVAAYVRSVLATIGVQGKPPTDGLVAPDVLVGNAARGKEYFAAKCASCHSATGDLREIGAKYPDAKVLQNTWVAGGGRARRGAPEEPSAARAVTASVRLPSGQSVDGRVLRIDDFYLTLALPDGTTRTFIRDGDVPKVEIKDPLQAHRDLLAVYSDQNMHDVTAYLVTLK